MTHDSVRGHRGEEMKKLMLLEAGAQDDLDLNVYGTYNQWLTTPMSLTWAAGPLRRPLLFGASNAY